MTKSQLIEAMAARQKLPHKEAEIIVNTIFDTMCETLIRGERIELRGFGSFKITKHCPVAFCWSRRQYTQERRCYTCTNNASLV